MPCRVDHLICGVLQRGTSERFELTPEGVVQLKRSLQPILRQQGAEHEVRRMLAISAALERELASPTASAQLLAILREDAIASWIVATKILRHGAVDETRSFLRSEGRDPVLRAPSLNDQPARPTTAEASPSSKVTRRRYVEQPIARVALAATRRCRAS